MKRNKLTSLFLLLALCSVGTGCTQIEKACDKIKETYNNERDAGRRLFERTKSACQSLKQKEEDNKDAKCEEPKNDTVGPIIPDSIERLVLGLEEPAVTSATLDTSIASFNSEDLQNFDGQGNSFLAVSVEAAASSAESVCGACSEAAAICASLGISPAEDGPLSRCCGGGKGAE